MRLSEVRFRILACDTSRWEASLKKWTMVGICVGGMMKSKIVVIVVELVDESVEERNEKIVEELRNWFREDAISIPWVKEVRDITVKEQ